MALHIKDPEAEAAVRKLAASRGVTLTEAVRQACLEALQLHLRNRPLKEKLDVIYRLVESAPATGEFANKAFFDELWGDKDEPLSVDAPESAGGDLSAARRHASRTGGRKSR
jgi:antitoxin VapB